METGDLDELVWIWEQWTNNNPVLRYALQSAEHHAVVTPEQQDGMLVALNELMHHATVDDAAAMYAGSAVSLALQHEGIMCSGHWQSIRAHALMAHQAALAGFAQDGWSQDLPHFGRPVSP